jgi:alpha-amylase
MKSTCSDTTLLGSFVENHDNVRFPSLTSDISLIKNAISFTILTDGIPISKLRTLWRIKIKLTSLVYYGQEQEYNGGSDPYNREALWFSNYPTTSTLYRFIASLNQVRNQAIYKSSAYLLYKAYPIYSDSSVIAMRKGDTGSQIVSVFTNQGSSGGSYTLTLSSSATGFTASQSLVEILSCTTYTTDGSGNLNVAMASGLPRVFYPATQLAGSGACGLG